MALDHHAQAQQRPGSAHPHILSSTPQHVAGDGLRVRLESRMGWATYTGTRAQLEAEGVVPVGTIWPAGKEAARWDAGGLSFCLCRARPEGMKGPMKLWIDADCWKLSMSVTGRDMGWWMRRRVVIKARELEQEIHAQTPEGQRARYALSRAYWAARDDRAFQAFKALVLPARKRSERPSRVRQGV